MVNSSSWIVNSYPATESLPSPATTTSSDDINKRNCTESGWQPTLAPSYQSPSFLPVTEHPIYDYSMSDSRAYSLSSDFSMFSTSGLPTPALSPPQVQYLAPMLLETQSFMQPSTLPSQGRSPYYSVMPTIPTQQQPSSSSRNNTSSSNFVPDDDEMVCIKLLGHLKRQSLNHRASMSLNAVHNLVNNTNAAIRRILNQPSTSDNQSCHLLLSNISIHLVDLCEIAARLEQQHQHHPQPQRQSSTSPQPHYLTVQSRSQSAPDLMEGMTRDTTVDHDFVASNLHTVNPAQLHHHQQLYQHQQPTNSASATGDASFSGETIIVIEDSLDTCRAIASLLRRRPISGFQATGRQESLHVSLDMRLVGYLAALTGENV